MATYTVRAQKKKYSIVQVKENTNKFAVLAALASLIDMSLNVWLKYQGPFQQLLIGLGSNISNLPRAPHVFDHYQVKPLRNWFIGNALILPSLFCLEDLAARALLKDFFPVSPQSAPFGSSVFIRSCCTPWSHPKSHSPNECCLLFLIRDVPLYQICSFIELCSKPC